MCGATSPPIGLPLYPARPAYIQEGGKRAGIASKPMMTEKSEKRLLDGEIKSEGHEKSHRSKIATKIIKPQKL